MITILNMLDGIYEAAPSIVFFTSNTKLYGIKELDAFMSRMRRIIQFKDHSAATYRVSLDLVLPDLSEENKMKIIDHHRQNNTSMRIFNNILLTSISYFDNNDQTIIIKYINSPRITHNKKDGNEGNRNGNDTDDDTDDDTYW